MRGQRTSGRSASSSGYGAFGDIDTGVLESLNSIWYAPNIFRESGAENSERIVVAHEGKSDQGCAGETLA
jgi:hypothetical protein